jgi:predicted nucleic acid-binding Zn ribbon protein
MPIYEVTCPNKECSVNKLVVEVFCKFSEETLCKECSHKHTRQLSATPGYIYETDTYTKCK